MHRLESRLQVTPLFWLFWLGGYYFCINSHKDDRIFFVIDPKSRVKNISDKQVKKGEVPEYSWWMLAKQTSNISRTYFAPAGKSGQVFGCRTQ